MTTRFKRVCTVYTRPLFFSCLCHSEKASVSKQQQSANTTHKACLIRLHKRNICISGEPASLLRIQALNLQALYKQYAMDNSYLLATLTL